MALVVECVGVPGVGKSYLTAMAVDELAAMGVVAVEPMVPVGPGVSKARRLGRKARFVGEEVARAPRAAMEMVWATVRTDQQRRRDTVAIALNWLVLRRLVRRARDGEGVHLFDQGAVLGLWSTGHRGAAGPCRRVLEGRAWSWVLPDAVVRVHAPVEVTLGQLRGRGPQQSRVEVLPDADLRRALEDAETELDEITGWWRGRRAGHDHNHSHSHSHSDGHGHGLDVEVVNPGDDGLRFVASELADDLARSAGHPIAAQGAVGR